MKRELSACVINVRNVYQYRSITSEDMMNRTINTSIASKTIKSAAQSMSTRITKYHYKHLSTTTALTALKGTYVNHWSVAEEHSSLNSNSQEQASRIMQHFEIIFGE
ncbi:hypothetical protein WN51_08670 [Melipona quadrifasciata]|uniref:Uncharacterized protein n=1 Tax=Melipona quadrifasciata TaxID=166423 RepID=A0A0N0BJB1_9HYME|nr:hypothetical protein WN51_08670 [Melipona quadrifasciata]